MTQELTAAQLIEALEFEATLGQLFLSYNQTTSVDGDIISKFLFSKGYYFEYNTTTALWVEIPVVILNNRIACWLKTQYQIIMRDNVGNTTNDILLSKEVRKASKVKYLEGVVKSIYTDLLDDSIFDKLDKIRPDYLPIKNQKVINLQTGETRQRSITDYFTWECPVSKISEYSEFFLNCIKNIMCNNEQRLKYFQKILGYCLTGRVDSQQYYIYYGKGCNGKSLILNCLQAVMGKACSPISKGVIVDCGKKASNGSEMISLRDLRLGTFSETSKLESLNESMLKQISGGDSVKARALYKEEISFKIFMKLIVCTNHRPEFDGGDFGTARRIKLLPFEAKFVSRDPKPEKNEYLIIENLETTLIEEHLDEFFSFCLEGAMMWYHDKKFDNIPDDIKEQQNAYIKEQNSFGSWFLESIKQDSNDKLNRSVAFNSYTSYCEELGIKALKKKEFFDKLEDEIGSVSKIRGVFVYKGYKLLEVVDNNHGDGLDD